MASLPTADDLGQRPTPQSRRQLAVVGNAGAVGDALAAAGVTMRDIGNRIEEVRDEDDVRRLDVEHAQRAREIRQRALDARGMNAEDARRQAEADLAALDQDILNRARSNTSRRALETMVARRTSVERDSITDFARRETTAAMDQSMTARIDTALDEAQERWNNPQALEESLNTVVAEIGNRGRWRGVSPEQVASEVAAARSRVRSSVVEQMIQADDYDGALGYLNAHAEEIDHDREVRLRGLVNGELQLQQADSDAADVLSAAPTAAPTPAPASAPTAPSRSTPRSEGDQPGRFRTGSFTIGDGYGARRGSDGAGTHQGMDAAAPIGTPWRVGREFEIIESHRQTVVRNGRDGGNIARVRIGNTEWLAMHLPSLPRPGRYGADANVLQSGDSGSATSSHPHIHWQPANAAAAAIYNQGRQATAAFLSGGNAPDTAQGRTPPPDGRRIDIEAAYAGIDARVRSGEWTEARGRRARERVRQVAGENDLVRARDRQDADEEITRALTQITAGGGRLMNINQLPAGALSRASPNVVLQIQETIRANNQPREPEANSPLMASLINRAAADPNGFLREVNPELYRGRITDGEVMQLHGMRNSISNRDGPQPSNIMSMIRFVLPETGLVTPETEIERQGSGRMRETVAQARRRVTDFITSQIFSGVQQRLARNFPTGTQPSEQDILDAVRAETAVITVNGQQTRMFQYRQEHPGQEPGRFDIVIPTRALPDIDAVLRASGRPVNGQERIAEYLRHKSRYDAR